MNTQILSIKLISCNYHLAFNELLDCLKKNLEPAYITVNNVHTIVTAVKDSYYSNILNCSLMALPDGRPLSIVARLKGDKTMQRVFGPTFLEKSLDWGRGKKLKHYFWGSSSDTLQKMKHKIEQQFPGVLISGMEAPPFRPLSDEENQAYIAKMNASGADVFWIALGAPKQEIWMYENYKKLNRGVMIGIGAGFDYLAGNTKHAPQWMKKYALEWLYRLIQEPGRLWKRYLVTNTLFIWYLLLELLHLKKFD